MFSATNFVDTDCSELTKVPAKFPFGERSLRKEVEGTLPGCVCACGSSPRGPVHPEEAR